MLRSLVVALVVVLAGLSARAQEWPAHPVVVRGVLVVRERGTG